MRYPISFRYGEETAIGRDATSPITAIGVLSLGLVLPIGAGPFTDRAIVALTSSAGPAKSVTLIRDGKPEVLETHAATVGDLLLEENIERSPDDALDVDPASPVQDGETIRYRAAVTITLVIDDTTQTIHTALPTVADVLGAQHVAYDAHDRLVPAADQPLTAGESIELTHVDTWTETVRKPIFPPVRHVPSFNLALGATRVVQAGHSGQRELTYLVTRAADRSIEPRRSPLASHVLTPPLPRIVATGIGEYGALGAFALRGFDGTLRFARSALAMVATAYTANCYGCTGITKSGRPAGHGIVAVDPAVIPLGSHLYIPGYGHAYAGDTGGAIRGNRIDLGFNSESDAMQFGRRPITVYVLHK
jgi:3D (Asp-Asp-Asp) domain-containing protein